MRHFHKYAKKDEYGIQRNLATRIAKAMLSSATPLPFAGSFIDTDRSLLKRHPVAAILGGQSAALGAFDKNVNEGKRKNIGLAAATSIAGAVGAIVPIAGLTKLLASHLKKYPVPPGFLGIAANKIINMGDHSYSEVLKNTAKRLIPLSILSAPIGYELGRIFGKKYNKQDYRVGKK